ncbi:MAG: GNAT family N-acetyltransferase [Chloroflexi bacterium]|nr:GNAT family N-acetyltransferase [Chloroflexota bacterium]
MREADIARLIEIRAGFTSQTRLKVEKSGSGYEVGWRLVEVPLETPYDKGEGYDFDDEERRLVMQRLARADSLEEVVIEQATDRLVGMLDVTEESWNEVAWVWNIMMDVSVRQQGLGRELTQRTIAWARQRNLRAVMLETQSNNVPACKFYVRMGFQLVGINEALYTNHDYQRDEIGLFWSYPLKP